MFGDCTSKMLGHNSLELAAVSVDQSEHGQSKSSVDLDILALADF